MHPPAQARGFLAHFCNAQIAALDHGVVPDALFNDRERAALAFADAILDGPCVADDTVAQTRERFSPHEVVELLLIVGYFRMIGSLMTTLEVELDPAWLVQALDQPRDAAVVA
jgi:alkylhydroperoxidase family enzyme